MTIFKPMSSQHRQRSAYRQLQKHNEAICRCFVISIYTFIILQIYHYIFSTVQKYHHKHIRHKHKAYKQFLFSWNSVTKEKQRDNEFAVLFIQILYIGELHFPVNRFYFLFMSTGLNSMSIKGVSTPAADS